MPSATLPSARADVVLLVRGTAFCDLKEIHDDHDVAVVGRAEDVPVSGGRSSKGQRQKAHTHTHTDKCARTRFDVPAAFKKSIYILER